MPLRTALLMAALSLSVGPLAAQVPEEERIPVTDPARLASLGFPKDANDVYVWSKAELGRPGAPQPPPQAAETWGTATGYTSIAGLSLQEESGRYIKLDRLAGYTHCVNGLASWVGDTETRAHVQFEVPDGARLGFLRYWAYDSSTDLDLLFRVYETRQGSGSGDVPSTTLIGESFTIGSGGDVNLFASLHDYPVDNKDCVYFIQVVFAPPDTGCQQQALRVRKFSVSWTRQVSPAPAAATFGDVPTSHAFFQFVEALAKSGITGGCGGGNFCPDQPLTRGQMAVFLAKALGLQWP